MSCPLIVTAVPWGQSGETGYFSDKLGDAFRHHQFTCTPTSIIEQKVRKPNLARIRCGRQVARYAVQHGADLVVSHDPRVTYSCQYFLKRYKYKGRHLAMSFNFPELPGAWMQRSMANAFSGVDRFAVFSKVELDLYARVFGVSATKFEFIHWGVGSAAVSDSDAPMIQGDYVCAIGGNARDYRTLMVAAGRLPEIRFVVVARPENFG